ncbi:Retrovirus-related Pol polyprotein from transposon 297 [Vitis vinifera]|uniref:Retrovirus-related Pol polyprotein from transposon 297 n=1 Tax=Vitis vinifera TaxID=29760 RepID=A0A438DLH1_VITVI|nr:Retrovirus-related Pol polyprotein from transposon 297 [Vitis vinifera]
MLSSANQGDWKIGENFQTRAVAIREKMMNQHREIPIKRLTESELQARREKGICFKCDEKFSLGHRCKKELRVLLVHEDEREEDNQFDERATMEPSLIELKDAMELSLNSVVGLTTPGTMKIKKTIGSKEGLTVVEDFLSLELGNTDVILGMPWLGTLGDVKVNWKMLTMKIKLGKIVILLKGDPSLSRTEVSLKAMVRALQHHGQGVWVELCQTSTTSELSEGVHKLHTNGKKCLFAKPQLEYLGHLVFAKGVVADPYKISAMVEWPTPKSPKELKGFLELIRQLFIVEIDASGYGLGAVLMQTQRLVANFSQVLSVKERQKSIYEKELMAIVLVVQNWHHYLLGRHFIVRTNQSSLKFLLEQRVVNESYQKWVAKLFGYDFEIQFRPELENKAADALSRIPISMELVALIVPNRLDTSLINSQVEAKPHLAKIRQRLLADPNAYPQYSLDHGLLYKGA